MNDGSSSGASVAAAGAVVSELPPLVDELLVSVEEPESQAALKTHRLASREEKVNA